MRSEFVTKLLVPLVGSSCIRGQREHYLAGGTLIAHYISHDIAVNIRERLLAQLQSNIRYRTLSEYRGHCMYIHIARRIVVVSKSFRAVQGIAVLSVFLDEIQRLVRELYERIIVISVIRDKYRAYRHTERYIRFLAHKLLCLTYKLRVYRIGYLLYQLFVFVSGAERRKFVPAEPCAYASRRKPLRQQARKGGKHLVAHIVPVDIVYRLEGIKVDHHKSTALGGAEL